MRIAIVNEGTYPVVTGGVSTWCHRLITELPEHEFHIVTLVGLERTSCWELPRNVGSTTLVPLWDEPASLPRFGEGLKAQRATVSAALQEVWAAVLPPDDHLGDLDRLRSALQALVSAGPYPLSCVLDEVTSTRAILDAWAKHRVANPRLPELTAAVAAEVARHADRQLAVLDADWPEVDVINATANGAASLVALARLWRDGTPAILSEHGVYLRERYLALSAARWPWLTRYVMMAFSKAICALVYRDFDAIAPVSDFNARWEVFLGADPSRVTTIPNAIEPDEFPELTTEPDVPTVAFVGRIDPLKDLATMIEAFAIVRETIPDALLRLFGPTPQGNEEYRAGLEQRIAELGLAGSVTFEGPTNGPQPALIAGHVIALSSISEGLPFSVIEAMMSGRATVNTDVGGVAECVGRDGAAGVVVPARDPRAFAAPLAWLLRDADRRRDMGAAARARALELFSIDVFRARYRELYAAVGEKAKRRATTVAADTTEASTTRRVLHEVTS